MQVKLVSLLLIARIYSSVVHREPRLRQDSNSVDKRYGHENLSDLVNFQNPKSEENPYIQVDLNKISSPEVTQSGLNFLQMSEPEKNEQISKLHQEVKHEIRHETAKVSEYLPMADRLPGKKYSGSGYLKQGPDMLDMLLEMFGPVRYDEGIRIV